MKTEIEYSNQFMTVITGYGAGDGDMKKSVYDTDGDGVVDNAERVNGHTVEEDVPAGAVFTDTVYDDTAIVQALAGKEPADPHIVKDNKNNTFTKSQKGNIAALTYAANVAIDLSLSNRYSLTLTGDCQINNPTNLVNGQGGLIYITQDATGGRVVTWGANYVFVNTPSEDTTADKVNMYAYETFNDKMVIQHIGAF